MHRASHPDEASRPTVASVTAAYRRRRDRVDAAHVRLSAVSDRPHVPAAARAAAQELTAALDDATAFAVAALRHAERTTGPRSRRTRDVPHTEVRRWTAELVRLAAIEQWLRRVTLDDPGVRFASTVRVGSRAANGPHVAGLEAEPRDLVDATLHAPRIGVDLRALVDAECGTTEAPRCHKR